MRIRKEMPTISGVEKRESAAIEVPIVDLSGPTVEGSGTEVPEVDALGGGMVEPGSVLLDGTASGRLRCTTFRDREIESGTGEAGRVSPDRPRGVSQAMH